MTNNDILRRVRYTLDLSDSQMMAVFAAAGREATRAEISDWLKKEDDDAHQTLNDRLLATFLNGLINVRRGKKEGAQPPVEKRLTRNMIFTKLKIALNLQAEDVLDILKLSDVVISKHELSAFFRKPTHKHYRECKDQILRNFLNGLQIKYRGDAAPKANSVWPTG